MDCLVSERLRMPQGTEEGEARHQSGELSKVQVSPEVHCTLQAHIWVSGD